MRTAESKQAINLKYMNMLGDSERSRTSACNRRQTHSQHEMWGMMENYQTYPVVPWATVESVRGWESSSSCWTGNKKGTQEWTLWVREYLLSIIWFITLPREAEIIMILHSSQPETSTSSYHVRYYCFKEDSVKMTSVNQVCNPSVQFSWFLL